MIIIFLVSMILETPYGAKINNFLRTLQLFRTSSDIFIIFSSPLLKFLALSGLKSFASSYTVTLLPQTRNLFHLAKLPDKTSSVMSFALI